VKELNFDFSTELGISNEMGILNRSSAFTFVTGPSKNDFKLSNTVQSSISQFPIDFTELKLLINNVLKEETNCKAVGFVLRTPWLRILPKKYSIGLILQGI